MVVKLKYEAFPFRKPLHFLSHGRAQFSLFQLCVGIRWLPMRWHGLHIQQKAQSQAHRCGDKSLQRIGWAFFLQGFHTLPDSRAIEMTFDEWHAACPQCTHTVEDSTTNAMTSIGLERDTTPRIEALDRLDETKQRVLHAIVPCIPDQVDTHVYVPGHHPGPG